MHKINMKKKHVETNIGIFMSLHHCGHLRGADITKHYGHDHTPRRRLMRISSPKFVARTAFLSRSLFLLRQAIPCCQRSKLLLAKNRLKLVYSRNLSQLSTQLQRTGFL